MFDILRDSTLGQLINYFSRGRLLPYADQRPGYILPARYTPRRTLESTTTLALHNGNEEHAEEAENVLPPLTPFRSRPAADFPHISRQSSRALSLIESRGIAQGGKEEEYRWLVTFEEVDSDDPRQWSRNKRVFIAGMICLLTFSVYLGSAIYVASIPGVVAEFHVSRVVATLGLSLFVCPYGIGPMLLSPLQETAILGRNPVYVFSLALFVIFQLPCIFAPNIGTILIFRFLAGFVGSPALATGGATIADLFPPKALPAGIGAWAMGAVCGPVFGPVVGGFAAQANGWKWPFWELFWLSAFTWIFIFLLLPETLADTILLRRAKRLRKLTGNELLKAPAELMNGDTGLGDIMYEYIVRTFQLCLEPAIFLAHCYISLVYAILYTFFESFFITFNEIHGFSLGVGGLPYLSFIVGAIITFPLYILYQKKRIEPMMGKSKFTPEIRLEVALIGSFFIPVSLFLFGWSARESVHWIVPCVGAALYLPGIYLSFQGIFLYVIVGYSRVAASVLAGNDFMRSCFASAFPRFGVAMFRALGLGGGCSLLAGVSMLMIPAIWALKRYGGVLRRRSKWTE
ncbi:major facilitator superfamily domain-containing protein, partial [Leucosporidium creatinivorum]